MAAKTYAVMNGAAPGAAAAVPISNTAAIKTHIQLATNTTTPPIRFVEWWAEFDGSTAATPVRVELIRHTGGAATTLTAYASADIARVNDPNAPTSSIQLGTALSKVVGVDTMAALNTPMVQSSQAFTATQQGHQSQHAAQPVPQQAAPAMSH